MKCDICSIKLDIPDWLHEPVLWDALQNGVYEGNEIDCVKAMLRPTDVFVEYGGGIGLVSAIAAKITQTVHVYEADSRLIPIIRSNWEANGISGPLLNHAAVTSKQDVLYCAPGFWGSSCHFRPQGCRGGAFMLPTVRFADELELLQATFAVVDIEGGEVELLEKDLPECLRAIVVEAHPAFVDPAPIWQSLERQNFKLDMERGSVRGYSR